MAQRGEEASDARLLRGTVVVVRVEGGASLNSEVSSAASVVTLSVRLRVRRLVLVRLGVGRVVVVVGLVVGEGRVVSSVGVTAIVGLRVGGGRVGVLRIGLLLVLVVVLVVVVVVLRLLIGRVGLQVSKMGRKRGRGRKWVSGRSSCRRRLALALLLFPPYYFPLILLPLCGSSTAAARPVAEISR